LAGCPWADGETSLISREDQVLTVVWSKSASTKIIRYLNQTCTLNLYERNLSKKHINIYMYYLINTIISREYFIV
jgi:hypothetical protein